MKYYPKLIKKEFITDFKNHHFWFQSLSFKVLKNMRERILGLHSLEKVKENLVNYLKIKQKAKLFYILLNSKKPISKRKLPSEINKEFKEIEQIVKENIWTVQKDLYLKKINRGIDRIKKQVTKTKNYFVQNMIELPPEICNYILKFVFIW